MAEPGIHIGTSGWSYKHWRGIYYPDTLKATAYLPFYAQSFQATEINASFYNLPKLQTVENWVKEVPKDFKFCPKMSRYLTHMKKLHDPEESLERFFEVFAPMKKQMGPVLVQLSPSLKFNGEIVTAFFKILKKQYKKFHFALEVRHATWLEERSRALLREYDIALVISQSGVNFPYAEMITSQNIYIRFHGPAQLYASSYPDEMLGDFAGKFKAWAKKGHTVWAFFNNDGFGFAVQNAKKLRELVKG
jgi:uncharacterized protein YecE (DUF72 family)